MPRTPRPGAEDELAFWPWFASTGVRSLVDRWLVGHMLVGVGLAFAVSGTLSSVAVTAFLPFASVLVGLAFAWGGNAMAVLQSPELHEIGNQPVGPGAYRDWVFSYQLAILILLATLAVWGFAALGLYDRAILLIPREWHTSSRLAGRASIFALSSMAVRESWAVVLGTQAMLLAQNRYRLEKKASPPRE